MGSSPIDLQMELPMQTPCQLQTPQFPPSGGNIGRPWLFPRRRVVFFGNCSLFACAGKLYRNTT
ncbi:hypothetical protein CO654_32035 [Rhizobium sp. L18]|nr:hypothetical protein CO654_32035 [Rhizobium sp. L18]